MNKRQIILWCLFLWSFSAVVAGLILCYRSEHAKAARYEGYVQCILTGQRFVMDPRDTWLVDKWATNVTVTAHPATRL